MKKHSLKLSVLTVLVFAAATLVSSFAQEAQWLTDKAKALEKAKAENKAVLMDFTGSDWCGWCIKMKKETLDSKEFAAYAAKNLVLLEVDFPNAKPQSAELKAQNEGLKQKYGIDGFPTFVLIDKTGKELGKAEGYVEGGPGAFIAKLEGFAKK
jgi:thioredoxin-related protein